MKTFILIFGLISCAHISQCTNLSHSISIDDQKCAELSCGQSMVTENLAHSLDENSLSREYGFDIRHDLQLFKDASDGNGNCTPVPDMCLYQPIYKSMSNRKLPDLRKIEILLSNENSEYVSEDN